MSFWSSNKIRTYKLSVRLSKHYFKYRPISKFYLIFLSFSDIFPNSSISSKSDRQLGQAQIWSSNTVFFWAIRPLKMNSTLLFTTFYSCCRRPAQIKVFKIKKEIKKFWPCCHRYKLVARKGKINPQLRWATKIQGKQGNKYQRKVFWFHWDAIKFHVKLSFPKWKHFGKSKEKK